MATAFTYQAVMPILKDIYGPRFEASGTYAAVCAWLELAGDDRRMSQRAKMPSTAWCHRFKVMVRERDPIESMFYTEMPSFALVGTPRKRPPPRPIDSLDVEGWRRPTCTSGDNKHWPRDPFTPAEAEHRRRNEMDLNHDGCPECEAT